MKKIILIVIIIMFSSQSYAAGISIPAKACFANRIGATACIGAVALMMSQAPVVIAAYIGSVGYSIWSYNKSVNNCKEDEISRDKIRKAREEIENQINNITVTRYNALRQVFYRSEPCQSRSEFHEIHDGVAYGKILYTNEELDKIFDFILNDNTIKTGGVDENDLWN